MNLLCWYIFIINAMRSCNERTTLHCVESYLYYIILVNKKNIFWGVKRGRKKIDRSKIYNLSIGVLTSFSYSLFWFRANQSLFLLLNAACLAEKQQIPSLYSSVGPDRGSNPQSTALEASMLTITPPMRFPVWNCFRSLFVTYKNVTGRVNN